MKWTHLHLALNHLPVLGVPFIGLVLIIAIIRRDVVWQKLSFWGYVALFWVTLAAKTTGDLAHEQVAKWPDFEQGVMKVHEGFYNGSGTSIKKVLIIMCWNYSAYYNHNVIPPQFF